MMAGRLKMFVQEGEPVVIGDNVYAIMVLWAITVSSPVRALRPGHRFVAKKVRVLW